MAQATGRFNDNDKTGDDKPNWCLNITDYQGANERQLGEISIQVLEMRGKTRGVNK